MSFQVISAALVSFHHNSESAAFDIEHWKDRKDAALTEKKKNSGSMVDKS